MSTDNLKLWSAVEKTDPEATKPAKVNGQQITAINGQYMIKRATEMFGPYGTGWGVDVVNEEYREGAPIMVPLIKDGPLEQIAVNIMHTMRVRLWYIADGEKKHCEQVGCTPFVYRSSYGATTDMEAPKKSLTDAVKKCLSWLGFSADIFMGMFDDHDYVEERKAEMALEQAENEDAEIERQKQERLEWVKSSIELLGSAVSMHELKTLHTRFVRSATRRGEDAYVKRLARAFEERKQELESKEAA